MGLAAGLMIGGGVLAAGGSVYGALAENAAAKAQAKVMKEEARVNDKRAQFAELQGSLEAESVQKRQIRAVAEGKGAYAGGNVLLEGGGTVEDWATGTAAEYEMERQMALSNAAMEAWGFRKNAWAGRAQASITRRAGTAALVKGGLSAGGSLLASAGMAASAMPASGGGMGSLTGGGTGAGGWSGAPRSSGLV